MLRSFHIGPVTIKELPFPNECQISLSGNPLPINITRKEAKEIHDVFSQHLYTGDYVRFVEPEPEEEIKAEPDHD